MRYQLHVRSQHAKRGRSGFAGPDTYVAVTVAPGCDDRDALGVAISLGYVDVPYALDRRVLDKRGIELIHFGEGYGAYRGPKSKLGRAIEAAEAYIAAHAGA